jgi:transposase
MLWKLFSGNFELVPSGEKFLRSFVLGLQHTTVSIVEPRRDFGMSFFILRKEADTEWVSVEGSYVRAHQHASGARRGEYRAIGRTPGGPTTKIHMAADAHGNPYYFEVTGGQVHDSKVAESLIDNIEAENLLADKGYDSEPIREKARSKNIRPSIPRRSNSKKPNPDFEKDTYKARHQVENLFARLKHFRSISMRFEKLARNFKAVLSIAC